MDVSSCGIDVYSTRSARHRGVTHTLVVVLDDSVSLVMIRAGDAIESFGFRPCIHQMRRPRGRVRERAFLHRTMLMCVVGICLVGVLEKHPICLFSVYRNGAPQ